MVVDFKRGVYEMALTELARFLPSNDGRNRFLRGNSRSQDDVRDAPARRGFGLIANAGLDLPPGASFDPDPGHPQSDS